MPYRGQCGMPAALLDPIHQDAHRLTRGPAPSRTATKLSARSERRSRWKVACGKPYPLKSRRRESARIESPVSKSANLMLEEPPLIGQDA
jgi:hypothetical protein